MTCAPAPNSHPTTTDDDDAQVPPLVIVSDLDDADFNDNDSIAPSYQEGEIHATDGDLFVGDSHLTDGDLANEEQNNVEYVSPRYLRRNHKKKGPLVSDSKNRCHNVFVV